MHLVEEQCTTKPCPSAEGQIAVSSRLAVQEERLGHKGLLALLLARTCHAAGRY